MNNDEEYSWDNIEDQTNCENNKPTYDVIISMATHKARFSDFQNVKPTFDSLVNQITDFKYHIVVNIFKGHYNNMPDEMKAYIEEHDIELVQSDINYKSHNKYLHVTKKYNNLPIILVDDDIRYSKHLVDGLMKIHKVYPKMAIAPKCTDIMSRVEGTLTGFVLFNNVNDHNKIASFDNFIWSGSGALLPENFYDFNNPENKAYVLSLINDCLYDDEIILGHLLCKNKIPVIPIPETGRYFDEKEIKPELLNYLANNPFILDVVPKTFDIEPLANINDGDHFKHKRENLKKYILNKFNLNELNAEIPIDLTTNVLAKCDENYKPSITMKKISNIEFILPLTSIDKLAAVKETVNELKKQNIINANVIVPYPSTFNKTETAKVKLELKDKYIIHFKSKYQFRNDLRNEGVKKATGKYVWIINETFRFLSKTMLSQLDELVTKNEYDCLAMSFMLTNGKITWKYYNSPLKTMADTKTINYESSCKIIRKEIFVDFPSKDYDSCDLYWWLKQMDKMSSAAVCESYIFSVSEDPELSRMKEFLKNNLLTFDQCVLTGILDVVKVKNPMIWEFVHDAVDLMSLKGSFKQAFAQNTWFDKIRIVMANLESGKFSF